MRSLKARFALLLGSTAIVVMLAALAALASIAAAEHTVDRTLEAQRRLELLAELSGRLTQFGLAAVETVGSPDSQPEAMAIARTNADKALATVDDALAESVPASADPSDRMQYAVRTRPMAQLRAARVVLDRQVALISRQTDPERRQDSIKGALNGFGAMTGQPLSFLIEAERRSMALGSEQARALSGHLRLAAVAAVLAALVLLAALYRSVTARRWRASRRCGGRPPPSAMAHWRHGSRSPPATNSAADDPHQPHGRPPRTARIARGRRSRRPGGHGRRADRRPARRQCRLEAVDRTRRRFFADVSHELRTPLTVILGECDIAMRGGIKGTEPAPAFATIRKRAQRLKLRVEDLLRVARSESGAIEFDKRPLGIASVLAEAVDNAASEAARRRVGLSLDPGGADVECLADREWIRQTVESLIDNAFRHARGLGRVEIALAAITTAGAPMARITVTDDGPGFGASESELFERFRRGASAGPDETGFGIGLALARWIVEQHGGAIRLGAGADGRGAAVRPGHPRHRSRMEARKAGDPAAGTRTREPAA